MARAYSLLSQVWDRIVERVQHSSDSQDTTQSPAGAVILGTTGNDLLVATQPAVVESLYGLDGDDTLIGQDSDLLNGGDGEDLLQGGGGRAVLDGGAGNDRIEAVGDATGLVLGAPSVRVSGGDGDDVIVNHNGGIVAEGGAGNDRLELGNAGLFSGDFYEASFYGNEGDDVALVEQTSNQDQHGGVHLFGGSGSDSFVATVILDSRFYGGSGTDQLTVNGAADLYGGDGSDDLQGGAGTQYLFGGSGADAIRGGGGDDWAYGDRGDDDVAGGAGYDRVFGGSGRDFVRGNNDNDVLYGGSGIDQLYGGNGDDVMYGGVGIDRLYGGAGRDNFVADGNYAQGVDRVMDFNFVEGDRIDLTADLGHVNVEDLVGYGYLRTVAVQVNGRTFAAVEVDRDGRANGENFESVMLVRTDHPDDLQGLDFWTISA